MVRMAELNANIGKYLCMEYVCVSVCVALNSLKNAWFFRSWFLPVYCMLEQFASSRFYRTCKYVCARIRLQLWYVLVYLDKSNANRKQCKWFSHAPVLYGSTYTHTHTPRAHYTGLQFATTRFQITANVNIRTSKNTTTILCAPIYFIQCNNGKHTHSHKHQRYIQQTQFV